jgi:hypothetical protein
MPNGPSLAGVTVVIVHGAALSYLVELAATRQFGISLASPSSDALLLLQPTCEKGPRF